MDYILRKKPLFKIVIEGDSFTLEDDKRKMHSGTFTYGDVIHAHYEQQKTNWLITIISFLVNFGKGSTYSDKTVFILKLENKTIKTHASDFDETITNQVIQALKRKTR